jgi:hypothetical protein
MELVFAFKPRANFGVAEQRQSMDNYLPTEREPLLKLCILEIRYRVLPDQRSSVKIKG